jgi:hypothetical protein
MKIRPNVQFASTLPDDRIEDEHDFIKWPGENISEAFREILARLGCRLGPIENLEDRGWEFDFVHGKTRLVCRVCMIDDYLVCFWDPSFFRKLFKRTHPDFVSFLRQFGDELPRDPRFFDIGWFTPEDTLGDLPGAERPVDDA